MRYFISTGEASGELAAVELARAIREYDPQAQFEGIGAQRMRDAGFTLWRNNTGWATLGPVEAIARIPKMFLIAAQLIQHVRQTKPDLMILVDFGAFHVRVAKWLRENYRYSGPILDWFPPSAWLDYESTAKTVASVAVPLPAFERQYDFYKRLGLPAVYFGHPLASRYTMRPSRPAPPSDGGRIALLPGSRAGERKRHVPVLHAAVDILKKRRPHLETVENVPLLEAIADVDAAFVASGTAVLETVLSGVPAVAMYILTPFIARRARKIYSGKYITIPNLVTNSPIIPEILQEEATPERLADAMDDLLKDPQKQYDRFGAVREALGPADALESTARFAFALAQTGRTA